MGILRELCHFLSCPEDHGPLRLLSDRMRCGDCGREFAAEDNFVSLLAREPASLDLGAAYTRGYPAARQDASRVAGWRLPTAALLEHKRRQVAMVKRLLLETGREDLVCDFSAGPGYYTLPYAQHWRWLIHGDLCLDSLEEAREQARRNRAVNILFVRMDYFQPPFRNTLPRILCLDTLIRGRQHEIALLRAILGSLTPEGSALVDFHNWWHNPLRRLGLLPDNFTHNRSYSRQELTGLLSQAGIRHYERFAFHQEAQPGSLLASLICRAIPPTRWIYRFRYATDSDSRST